MFEFPLKKHPKDWIKTPHGLLTSLTTRSEYAQKVPTTWYNVITLKIENCVVGNFYLKDSITVRILKYRICIVVKRKVLETSIYMI